LEGHQRKTLYSFLETLSMFKENEKERKKDKCKKIKSDNEKMRVTEKHKEIEREKYQRE